jgi:hypothetical protein
VLLVALPKLVGELPPKLEVLQLQERWRVAKLLGVQGLPRVVSAQHWPRILSVG